MKDIFKIQRKKDGKYVYQISSLMDANMIERKVFKYTSDLNKAKIFNGLNSAEKEIKNSCDKVVNERRIHDFQERYVFKKQKRVDFEILQFSLVEKNMCKQIEKSKRWEFVYMIFDKETKKYIIEYYVSLLELSIKENSVLGKIFVEYSVAENFIKYMVMNFEGFRYIIEKDSKKFKEISQNFQIIPFTVEKMFKRILLLEFKRKPKKRY